MIRLFVLIMALLIHFISVMMKHIIAILIFLPSVSFRHEMVLPSERSAMISAEISDLSSDLILNLILNLSSDLSSDLNSDQS